MSTRKHNDLEDSLVQRCWDIRVRYLLVDWKAESPGAGDVSFPGLAGFSITVRNLRGDISHLTVGDDLDQPTPVYHRLILRTVVRPLWDYTSDRDLLTWFRNALEGECLLIAGYHHLSLLFSAQDPL